MQLNYQKLIDELAKPIGLNHAPQPFRCAAGKTFHSAESAVAAAAAAVVVAVAADKGSAGLAAGAASGKFVGLRRAAEPYSSRGELPRQFLQLLALDAGLPRLMPHSTLHKSKCNK